MRAEAPRLVDIDLAEYTRAAPVGTTTTQAARVEASPGNPVGGGRGRPDQPVGAGAAGNWNGDLGDQEEAPLGSTGGLPAGAAASRPALAAVDPEPDRTSTGSILLALVGVLVLGGLAAAVMVRDRAGSARPVASLPAPQQAWQDPRDWFPGLGARAPGYMVLGDTSPAQPRDPRIVPYHRF